MTSKSLELLNAVQKLLVSFATESGIDLRAEFGTVEAFKKFVIAFTFKQLVELGVAVNEAYDMVLGDGSYDDLAAKVWDAAN